jgi:hypothetical protein
VGGSPRAVLSQEDLLKLIDPLVRRINSGALPVNEAVGCASGIVHGGVPLDLFIRNPEMPLDLTSLEAIAQGMWLPSHLSEHRMSPEQRKDELCIQQERIVAAVQGALSDTQSDLPVFFLGSAVAKGSLNPHDIDIGTSSALRSQHMKAYDDVFHILRSDRMSSSQRARRFEGPIDGNQNHVGAVWSHFLLALGVSVHRYERALRITPSDIYVIKRAEEDRTALDVPDR